MNKYLLSLTISVFMLVFAASSAHAGFYFPRHRHDGDGNSINFSYSQDVTVVQPNVGYVSNFVFAKSETGDNDADKNTGGDVSVKTGSVNTTIAINNTLNSNFLKLNLCCDKFPDFPGCPAIE